MAETLRTPEANLSPSLQPLAKEMLRPKEVPSYEDVITGVNTVIGGIEIPQSTINSAKGGDKGAETYIRSQIDLATISGRRTPPIAGTKITSEGIKLDLPEDLPEKKKEEFIDYIGNRSRIYKFLEGKVPDPRVRDLLIDHYETGEFFEETSRQLAEIPRFFGAVPNYISTLARFVAPAIIESGPLDFIPGSQYVIEPSEITFSEAYAKRQPQIALSFANYKKQLQDNGVNITYGGSLNDLLKQKFIEKHGKEVYDRDYNPTLEGLGQIENPLVSEDLAGMILEFGFDELPYDEKFASYLTQNAPISGFFGKLHLLKGQRQLRKVAKYKKENPNVATMDSVSIVRKMEIEERTNRYTKNWRKMTARIGQKFGNRGAIGNVEANESARSAIKNIDEKLKDAKKRRKAALNNQSVDKNKRRLDAEIIDGEISALNSRRNRILFGGRGNPFMFNLFIDESVIAIGQTAGHYIAPAVGLEAETGEVIGALGFAFVGRPIIKHSVATPFKITDFVTGYGFSTIGMNTVQMLEDLRFLPKGVFVNRSVAELEATIGRQLTASEASSFGLLDKLMKGMTNEQRENIYRSIENYNELRDRIIKRFPEGEARQKAEEVFKLSFGHISGLAPLQAMELASLKNINAKGLQEAVEFQLQSENSLDIAETALNQLNEMIKAGTGVDPEDSKFLAGWVKNFQAAADNQRVQIEGRKQEYLEMLRQYKNNILSDPTVDIDKDIVNNLAELEIALVPGAKDSIEQQREIILQTATDVRKRINERANIIKDMRGTDEYMRQLGILQEDIYDAHMSTIYAIGRNAYKNADKAIGQESIDISSAVDAFVQSQNALDSRDLRGLFNPQRTFLNSRSGKMAFNAFNDMAERSLREDMGLDDDDIADLFKYFTTEIVDGKRNEDFMGEVISFVDIALHLSKTQADAGKTFQPFKAKPFEVDEVKRHLSKMAASKKESADAKPFEDFANAMESALQSNARVYEEVEKARDIYRDLIFDPTRPSSTGEKIMKSSTGPDFVTKVGGGYKRPYVLGMEPETWHRDLALAINDAIEGKPFASLKVRTLVDDLSRFWGDRDEAGEIVFDLTTEAGRQKFENVANLVKANLYEYWGAAKEKGLSAAKRQALIGGDISRDDYDFEAVDNLMDKVLPALQVRVQMSTDTIEGAVDELGGMKFPMSRPLFDIRDLVTSENYIVDILSVSASVRKDYREFADDVNAQVGARAAVGQTAIDLDSRIAKNFENLAGTKDAKQFYEQYVLTNDVELMRGLKTDFIETMTKDGAMTVEAAEEEFKQGMIYMMTNGLLARAGMEPNREITFKAMDGTRRTQKTIMNAATIVSDLDNPNVTAILEEFMDDDHIAFLQDIGEYMMYASGSSLGQFAPKGQIRGISPNEVISRAFNIARGMVSPTYVAAEFAFRIMSQHDVNALGLAASDKEAAKIMQKILETPGTVTKEDVQTLGILAKAFLVKELKRRNIEISNRFVPQHAVTAAEQELQREENETVQ